QIYAACMNSGSAAYGSHHRGNKAPMGPRSAIDCWLASYTTSQVPLFAGGDLHRHLNDVLYPASILALSPYGHATRPLTAAPCRSCTALRALHHRRRAP